MSTIITQNLKGPTSGGNANKVIMAAGQTLETPEVIQSNYMIDMWRLTTNFDTNAATITGWERPDDASSGRIGTGMTESSGVFTFPSTGVYLVTTHFRVAKLGAGDATLGYLIAVSTDGGSSNDTVATGYEGDQSSSTVNQNASIQALVNVTNASNFQVFFQTTSMANSSRINGNSNENQSIVTFERKGPSQ